MDSHHKYKKYKSKYRSITNDIDTDIDNSNLEQCKKLVRLLKTENEMLKEKLNKIYYYNYSNIPEYTKSI